MISATTYTGKQRTVCLLSSGILRRLALVRTDVSEEIISSIIRILRLLATANVVPKPPILVATFL
jgi:hypothetical protein